jgi:hypothetical protein
MSLMRIRLVGVAAVCVALAMPALGFGTAIAQASFLPAPMDDPAPPPPAPPAPDPSTMINEANTILPVISQLSQYLPSILDPGAALQDPGTTGSLQPQMLDPYAPGN